MPRSQRRPAVALLVFTILAVCGASLAAIESTQTAEQQAVTVPPAQSISTPNPVSVWVGGIGEYYFDSINCCWRCPEEVGWTCSDSPSTANACKLECQRRCLTTCGQI